MKNLEEKIEELLKKEGALSVESIRRKLNISSWYRVHNCLLKLALKKKIKAIFVGHRIVFIPRDDYEPIAKMDENSQENIK